MRRYLSVHISLIVLMASVLRDAAAQPTGPQEHVPLTLVQIIGRSDAAVHVRVSDAATGEPTPVLIRFTDEKGNYYAPFGRLAEFPTKVGLDLGGNLLLNDKRYA